MNEVIEKLIEGAGENHMLPFFWQHGENEETLRRYMRVIQESGCGAVCVESRPHPDFCGDKWWQDMDVILDEARTRGMKVWILDDSHFPTGFANGAVESAPDALRRQSVCAGQRLLAGEPETVRLDLSALFPPPFVPSRMESYVLGSLPKPPIFADDQVLSVIAVPLESREAEEGETGKTQVGAPLSLSGFVREGVLCWEKPAGKYRLWITGLSRNFGPHRNYINMMNRDSVRLLIDAVYEPHWARYRSDFGGTIAGFFSDEPELGNGHLYDMLNPLGTDQDLPFSADLARDLESSLGENWADKLYLLWENDAPALEKARLRFAYMDAVTKRLRSDFSFQLRDWCHDHGVRYIGHIIEDNGAHARTGSGVGHYFRGLQGQDMAGIDDIGGQVYPGGEEDYKEDWMGRPRNAAFFHFLLGRLASSAAAIEPAKQGLAMCEIFGNYGWAEGVRLEKYLADHFMVRGVNVYVPHAFSPAPFPDPDCPPHFYAQGHNPQYRHFGELVRYMNRVCGLISSGTRPVQAAILYHGEAEWAGDCLPSEQPAKVLEEHQISFDVIPCDVFAEPERYRTRLGKTLQVNTQHYQTLIVPYAQFVTAAFARAAGELVQAGCSVVFVEGRPEGICDGHQALLSALADCPVVRLQDLGDDLENQGLNPLTFTPGNPGLRVLPLAVDPHREDPMGAWENPDRENSSKEHPNQGDAEAPLSQAPLRPNLYFLVNEGTEVYRGTLTLPHTGNCYGYNPWENRREALYGEVGEQETVVWLALEPLKSLVLVFEETEDAPAGEDTGFPTGAQRKEETDEKAAEEIRGKTGEPVRYGLLPYKGNRILYKAPVPTDRELPLGDWQRSLCRGIDYPDFGPEKAVRLPDRLAEEEPEFSGFARYVTEVCVTAPGDYLLEISDAAEGVEVFLDGKSLGIQIAPPYRYHLTLTTGDHELAIEVATTLERQCYPLLDERRKFMADAPAGESGLYGEVKLFFAGGSAPQASVS